MFQSCDILLRLTRCSTFRFLNPFIYLPMQFALHLLGGNTCIHVSCYLLVLELIFRFISRICFLFFVPGSSLELYHQFSPACKSCLSILDSQWMVIHTNERNILICLCPYKLMRISLSAHKFLLFNPWHYMLNVSTSATRTVNIFSIAVHKFPNYFEKCPLFGQILITCLKCSKAFLLLSS